MTFPILFIAVCQHANFSLYVMLLLPTIFFMYIIFLIICDIKWIFKIQTAAGRIDNLWVPKHP